MELKVSICAKSSVTCRVFQVILCNTLYFICCIVYVVPMWPVCTPGKSLNSVRRESIWVKVHVINLKLLCFANRKVTACCWNRNLAIFVIVRGSPSRKTIAKYLFHPSFILSNSADIALLQRHPGFYDKLRQNIVSRLLILMFWQVVQLFRKSEMWNNRAPEQFLSCRSLTCL